MSYLSNIGLREFLPLAYFGIFKSAKLEQRKGETCDSILFLMNNNRNLSDERGSRTVWISSTLEGFNASARDQFKTRSQDSKIDYETR